VATFLAGMLLSRQDEWKDGAYMDIVVPGLINSLPLILQKNWKLSGNHAGEISAHEESKSNKLG